MQTDYILYKKTELEFVFEIFKLFNNHEPTREGKCMGNRILLCEMPIDMSFLQR